MFNLEKEFDIKIPRGELFPENLAAEGDGLAVDGVVTEEGLTKLREKLPFADIEAFVADPQVAIAHSESVLGPPRNQQPEQGSGIS